MKYEKKYFTKTTTKSKNNYKFYLKLLESEGIILNNLQVLDIGCATGNFLENIYKNNICFGLDISKYAIYESQNKFPDFKDNFKICDLNIQEFETQGKFDLITIFDVIEHIDNYSNLKKIICNNLNKGGKILITTPNANSILRFISTTNFTGEIDPTHVNLFTPYTLDFFLRKIGLKKIKLITPFSFYFNNNILTSKILLGGQIVALYEK